MGFYGLKSDGGETCRRTGSTRKTIVAFVCSETEEIFSVDEAGGGICKFRVVLGSRAACFEDTCTAD